MRQVLLLGDDWPAIHPIQGDQQRWINLGHLRCLDQLALDVVEVGLLVVWDGSNVLKQLRELRRKDIRRKQFLRLDLVLVLHHFLQALLVRLVAPRQLAHPEVAEQEEQRLNIVLFQILFVRQVRSQGGVHRRADNSEVILLFKHELLQCLHGRLLLARLRINQVLWIIVCTRLPIPILRRIDRRIRATLLLRKSKINQINEVRLIRIISNNNIRRLQISMNVALRVNALQPIHKLQRYDYNSLYLKLALFERFLQLLQIDSEQLHHQVIVILIRAIRIQPRKADPPILGNHGYGASRALFLLLLLLQFGIQLNGFRVLILHTILLQWLLFGKLHHIFHKRNFSLEFRLVLTRFLHLQKQSRLEEMVMG